MARPFKDEITKKHDRIIAKVYSQLYRWGFSSKVIEPVIATVAYRVLGRARITQTGNGGFMSNEDILSGEAIKKIYQQWSKENPSYFSRINHPKVALQYSAPKQEHLDEVVSFFMKYMDQEPERCIFATPPTCTTLEGYMWWRMYDGELDGDLPLNPRAKERASSFPKIKKK